MMNMEQGNVGGRTRRLRRVFDDAPSIPFPPGEVFDKNPKDWGRAFLLPSPARFFNVSKKLATSPNGRGVKDAAFTLVELLVVISIIILLAGMLLPSLSKAITLSYVATSRSRLSTIVSAITQFKSDKGYYPGLESGDRLLRTDAGVTGDINLSSGSEVLGLALWGRDTYWENDGSGAEGLYYDSGIKGTPTSNYLGYKAEFAVDPDNNNYRLSDGFPDPMVVAYWPCDPSTVGNMKKSGTPAQADFDTPTPYAFQWDDSSADCSPGGDADDWKNLLFNDKFSKAYNYDSYLLIAPGADRKYFYDISAAGVPGDDVTNINR